ncbi:MAG: radical SAM protein [Candidatus Omnitrophota bacterium]
MDTAENKQKIFIKEINLYMDYNQWYEDIYPRLSGCGLWLRGGEINTLDKDEFEKRFFRVLFVRLSTYRDTAGSFTHQLLYQIAADIDYVFPDIAYLPPPKDALIFKKNNVPWLLGTNTRFGPEKFSLIAFSNSIVQEVINIASFLKNSNIPLSREERMKREDIPPVILGGANAIFTSSIWGKHALIDGIFTGTASGNIRKIFELCAESYMEGMTKVELFSRLNKIPGFYSTALPAPNHKMPEMKCVSEDALYEENTVYLKNGIVPYLETGMGTGYLEISSGCRAFCSFCSENWTRKPYKETDVSTLLDRALSMKAEMGLERVDVFSFNFNMYKQFYTLLRGLTAVFNDVNLKSQRFDMLAGEKLMVEYQQASGKNIYSCGLEGISNRLRKYLNKNLDEELFVKSVELIFRIQARELKIFLLSTGMEDEEDFKEFRTLLKQIEGAGKNVRTKVLFSVTPLIRFPWTPLEFDTSCPPQTHIKTIKTLDSIIKEHGFESRSAMDANEYFVSQLLVRSADWRIRDVLLKTLEETGFVYYRGISGKFYNSLNRHLVNAGIKPEDMFRGFTLKESYEKPWAVINTGIRRKALWDIYQKNTSFQEISTFLSRLKIDKPSFSIQEYREEMKKKKENEININFHVNIKDKARGFPRKYFGIALTRALMKTDSALIPYFNRYVSSLWEEDSTAPVWITGDDLITLCWDRKAVSLLEKLRNDPELLKRINTHLNYWGNAGANIVPADKDKTVSVEQFRFSINAPYHFDGTNYFKKRNLNYIMYRNTCADASDTAETVQGKDVKQEKKSYTLKFTNDSLKKKILLRCGITLIETQNSFSNKTVRTLIVIHPGPKFLIEQFLKEAFILPHKNDLIKIHTSSQRI